MAERIKTKSQAAFLQAQKVIPGGVNSPVRAYGSVGGEPPFIQHGEGALIYDLDGNEYIDYVLSWGPLILGHAHPAVVEAVRAAAGLGLSFGAPTEAEVELAVLVKERMPHVEMIRLVNSGTEAVMTALRLARAYTDRNLIVKFDGCYHGHSDGLLVKAGSGLATGGLPASKGVPSGITGDTLSIPYNNPQVAADLFHQRGDEIAAVIVEPVAANMGVVLPENGFLQDLRDLTQRYGSCLIFDEVITGFRIARGGATEYFGITPDLVCLGKILGGGMPIGGVGGRREIMEMLAPLGEVYQAGTLSGNPISVAAGIATLKELSNPEIYKRLEAITDQLAEGLEQGLARSGIEAQVNNICGLLTVFLTPNRVRDFVTAKDSNLKQFRQFFHAMLDQSIYLPPSPFEAWFLSTRHDQNVISGTLQAQRQALNLMG